LDWEKVEKIGPIVSAVLVTIAESFVLPYFLKIQLSLFESLTLLVLQFLAFTAVAERHGILLRVENLLKKEKFFVDRQDLPHVSERLKKAKRSIWISAITFGYLIGVESGLIERKYEEGCEIKILLLNPNKVSETGKVIGVNEELLRSQIQSSIDYLGKFKDKRSRKKGIIQAKLMPSFPGFGLFIIDADAPDGEIKLELVPCESIPAERPNVIITRKEAKRYDQFKEHFDKLWELSEPI